MYLTITSAFLGRSFTTNVTMNHFQHNHVRSTSVALYSKTFIYLFQNANPGAAVD